MTKTNKIFEIPEHLSGQRIDSALSEILDEISRSKIKTCLQDGRVTVNEEIIKKISTKVLGGERVEIIFKAEESVDYIPQNIKISVLDEQDDFIVLNKSPGLVVHPGAGNKSKTLLNGLLYKYPDLKKLPRGGIVHRLDKDTSGLMVVAKNERALLDLSNQISNRTVSRIYDAFVVGNLKKSGKIDLAIGRHPNNRQKQAVQSNGREAITHYSLKENFGNYSHLELKLETGRTHQIRVHLSHTGFPIIGDPLYGRKRRFAKSTNSELREIIELFPRQALHASKLSFKHPSTKKPVNFVSELPEDMRSLKDKLAQLA
ncbi:MAG: RluA family pseudouridine synthase [Gammaproteobacteria bacterium]|jgi:23S rRNA pseudouridine1911/1915/1917 synthase|tara:strand:+ start:2302 stop:3249 length:948 start_codon:yes stop_codon:yes gene_type:complete